MIKLNNEEIRFTEFPNGEVKLDAQSVKDAVVGNSQYNELLYFKYENDSDLIKLMFVKYFLDSNKLTTSLIIAYMPYSRMDRVEEHDEDCFTLKSVAKLINDLNFEHVLVIEPHSDVTTALLNNAISYNINYDLLPMVEQNINFDKETDYLFFPDAGAQKRYSKLKGYKNLVGYKHRDFKTGEIESLEVVGKMPEQKRKIIIVDDLCSRGTTFIKSAEKLKELGFEEIYLLVAHCESTIFEGYIFDENSNIKKVFATNSMIDPVAKDDFNYAGKLEVVDIENIVFYS